MYRLKLGVVFVFLTPYISHLLKDVQSIGNVDIIIYVTCFSLIFSNVGKDYKGVNKFKTKNPLDRGY